MQEVFCVFGAVIVASVGYVVGRAVLRDRRARDWPLVDGVVESDRPTSYGPTSSLWHVEVRFRTARGETVQAWAENPLSSSVPHRAGTPVQVRYDPDDPRRFQVAVPGAKSSPWVTVLFLAAVSLGVLVVVLSFL